MSRKVKVPSDKRFNLAKGLRYTATADYCELVYSSSVSKVPLPRAEYRAVQKIPKYEGKDSKSSVTNIDHILQGLVYDIHKSILTDIEKLEQIEREDAERELAEMQKRASKSKNTSHTKIVKYHPSSSLELSYNTSSTKRCNKSNQQNEEQQPKLSALERLRQRDSKIEEYKAIHNEMKKENIVTYTPFDVFNSNEKLKVTYLSFSQKNIDIIYKSIKDSFEITRKSNSDSNNRVFEIKYLVTGKSLDCTSEQAAKRLAISVYLIEHNKYSSSSDYRITNQVSALGVDIGTLPVSHRIEPINARGTVIKNDGLIPESIITKDKIKNAKFPIRITTKNFLQASLEGLPELFNGIAVITRQPQKAGDTSEVYFVTYIKTGNKIRCTTYLMANKMCVALYLYEKDLLSLESDSRIINKMKVLLGYHPDKLGEYHYNLNHKYNIRRNKPSTATDQQLDSQQTANNQ